MLDANIKMNFGNFDVDLGIKGKDKKSFPIYFKKRNICVHCGAEDTLAFMDIFGHETEVEVHPFEYIKCKRCGTKYDIMWKRDEDTGEMIPCPVDRSFKQNFINLISNNKIKENGAKNVLE